MYFRNLLLALGLLALPATAWAQPIEGLYVGAGYEFTTISGSRFTSAFFPPLPLSVSSTARGSRAAQGMVGVAFPIGSS